MESAWPTCGVFASGPCSKRIPLRPFARSSPYSVLEKEARREVLADGVAETNVEPPNRSLDLRYQGVEGTINVPCSAGDPAVRYAELHEQLYGYRREGRPLEIVAARVEVVGTMPEPPDPVVQAVPRQPLRLDDDRNLVSKAGRRRRPSSCGRRFRPGDEFDGPAIVLRADLHCRDRSRFPRDRFAARGRS